VRSLRIFFLTAICICGWAVLGSSAQAQTNASLRGTVTDQSGGVIVGAKVTLTNTGTGISRTDTTQSEGGYLFELVQVGSYRVTFEKSGFATFVREGIVLELNQNGRLDVALKVGKTTETIEVTGNVAQVDTTSAVLGKVENRRMIEDLPLADRDTLQLGLLQAGVFNPDPDDGSGNPFSVSGQRSESLTFTLDGANNTDFLGNNIVVNPNPDAIQEFKILTNNYDAQYGRTSGGIVNQITKSGTNDFHGVLFEFNRNNIFNARDFFLPSSVDKQTFKRNVFGATIGGPIKKDKTFFFLDYQGWRSREGQTSPILTVLDQNERGGNFGELCSAYDAGGNCTAAALANGGTQLINPVTGANIPNNNLATAGLVDPVIQNYINRFLPTPNLPNNGFVSSPTAAIDQDQGIMHLDHHLTPQDTLSFVYVINDLRDNFPFLINKGASTGGDVPIGSGFSDADRAQIGSFTWTHIFSPTKINEFRFAASRFATLQAVPTDNTSPAALGFTNVNPDDPKGTAPPIIFTNSFNLGPSPQGPTRLKRATFEWADNYTWNRGNHIIQFGGDFTRIRQNYNFDFFNNGSFDFTFGDFTGNELADFVGGFWDNYFQFSNAVYGIRTGSYAGYVQDTWKIRPRLTLIYGVRYEYNVPQSDVHNNILGFFPGKQSTRFPDAPPDILYPGDPGTPNNALVYPDRNNFAPRFGFAWDIFGSSKLVMRGGFGIFYDIEDGALNLQFGGQPPFGATSNIFPSGFSAPNPVADPYGASGFENPFPFASRGLVGTFLSPKIPFAYTTFPHFRTPYSENFNYGFQWQATGDTMIEAVFVGSLGRKLISSVETNFPVPSVEMQQLANFGSVNIDCARPLAACVNGGGTPVTGPNAGPDALPTGATQLLTNTSSGLSDSYEFQLTADRRLSKRISFRAAYTVSKTIDLTSGFRSRSGEYTDPLDPRLDRGLADFDTPQRFVLSWIWEVPFDAAVHSDGLLKKVARGWQLNGIASFQKGQPTTLFSNSNSSQQNNFLDRPDVIGPIQIFKNPRNEHTANVDGAANCVGTNGAVTGMFWFNPDSFDCNNVPIFTFGDMGRNVIRGPGINNWDLSITKKTSITESKSLEFRAEFFNAFNHAQFLNPDNAGGSGTFGQILADRGPRILQFGLKLYY
jgi:hypothetical protein